MERIFKAASASVISPRELDEYTNAEVIDMQHERRLECAGGRERVERVEAAYEADILAGRREPVPGFGLVCASLLR